MAEKKKKSFSHVRSPSSPFFARFKFLQVFDLVKVLNINFIHQFVNERLLIDIYDTFSFTIVNYNTRNKALDMLKLLKINTIFYGSNSLCMQSILNETCSSNFSLTLNYLILAN